MKVLLSLLLLFNGIQESDPEPLYLQSEKLGGVRQLDFSGEYIAAANNQQQRIEVFDRNTGEQLATFGREGDGPGEFGGLESVAIHNSMIYGADVANNRVLVFEMGEGYRQTLNFDDPFNLIHLTAGGQLILLNTLNISQPEQPLIAIANPEDGTVTYQGYGVSEELSRFRIGTGHAWTVSSNDQSIVFTHPYMYELAVIRKVEQETKIVDLEVESEIYEREDLSGFQPPQSSMSDVINAFTYLVSLQDDGLYVFSSGLGNDNYYLEVFDPDIFELKSSRLWQHDRPSYVEDGIAYTVTIDEEAERYHYKIIPIEL